MRIIHLSICLFAIVIGSAQNKLPAVSAQQDVFTRIAQMPEFPGKTDSLIKFMAAHLQYPKSEMKSGIEGIVGVKFIVNTDGSISDITVPRKLGTAFDNEAVRVVKLLPNFVPGREGGKPVRVYYAVAAIFKLPK